MKVKDLIVLLQKCDQEVSVITEGCDCFGIPADVITLGKYYSKGVYADTYRKNTDVIIIRGTMGEII